VEFRILGPLVVLEGGRQLRVSGARERELLAILLIHAGEVVSADRLIDHLWGSDLPASPSNALQVVVSRIRKILGASPALVTRRPGYVLDVHPEELDARRFAQLVEQAGRSMPVIRRAGRPCWGKHSGCGGARRSRNSRWRTSRGKRLPGSRRHGSGPLR
jgi:DNA-binding SARP family transcriptional activator